MAENDTKKETVQFYADEQPAGQEDVDYLYYGVQGVDENGDRCRANVSYPIPKSDEEAKARYDCGLAMLIMLGVRAGIATRPNYPLEFLGRETAKDGKVIDRGCITQDVMEACQKLADEYKCGQKVVSVSKEAKEINAMRKAGDMSMDDMKEAIKLFREQNE